MRTIMLYGALVACFVAFAKAQERDQPRKEAITDATIINSCGGPLDKMFAQFGTPRDLRVNRGNKPEEDDVYCSYENHGFRVRNKVIRMCFFFRGWKEPIRGIRIGDSREAVAKILGNPSMTVKNKDGTISAYGYELKELNSYFFANFDKDGQVWRVEVSLK